MKQVFKKLSFNSTIFLQSINYLLNYKCTLVQKTPFCKKGPTFEADLSKQINFSSGRAYFKDDKISEQIFILIFKTLLKTIYRQLSHQEKKLQNKNTKIMYSKASRYVVLRCVVFVDSQFVLGPKHFE